MALASGNMETAGERNHRAAVRAETLSKCPLCRRLEMPWRSRNPTPGCGAFLTTEDLSSDAGTFYRHERAVSAALHFQFYP